MNENIKKIKNAEIEKYLNGLYKIERLNNGFTKVIPKFDKIETVIKKCPRNMDEAYVFCFNVLKWLKVGDDIVIKFSESTLLKNYEEEQLKIILDTDNEKIENYCYYIEKINNKDIYRLVMFLYFVILYEIEGDILASSKRYISFRDGYLYFICDGQEIKNEILNIIEFTEKNNFKLFFH